MKQKERAKSPLHSCLRIRVYSGRGLACRVPPRARAVVTSSRLCRFPKSVIRLQLAPTRTFENKGHRGVYSKKFATSAWPPNTDRIADVLALRLRAQERTSPPTFRQQFRDLAGAVDEKLCNGTERAVLQGDDADWHVRQWQVDGQDL